jgi:hypothetical protein
MATVPSMLLLTSTTWMSALKWFELAPRDGANTMLLLCTRAAKRNDAIVWNFRAQRLG